MKKLSGDHRELLPRWIEEEGEWREFTPAAGPPAWWPMTQALGAADPPSRWDLAPAAFPGDTLSRVGLSAEVPAATAADLVAPMADLEATYAFLHYWTSAEPLPNPVGLRRDGDDGRPWVLLVQRDVATALPDLYWAQLLGPAWVEHIGADRVSATPAHRVEEVRPGHWLVQLTPDPADVAADFAAFTALRARCREHLGEQHFWRRDLDAAPVLDLPQVVG